MADDERNEEEKDEQEKDEKDDSSGDGEGNDSESSGDESGDSGDESGGGDDDSGDDSGGDDSDEDDSDGEDSGDDDSDEDDSASDDGSQSKDATPSLSAKEMTRAAIDALRELTGREPEAATGLMWDGEAWLVTVDVLELARIPNTTDLIATYVVELDGDGNLSGYKRTRRFQRGAAEEG
jgi:hypothetical protein